MMSKGSWSLWKNKQPWPGSAHPAVCIWSQTTEIGTFDWYLYLSRPGGPTGLNWKLSVSRQATLIRTPLRDYGTLWGFLGPAQGQALQHMWAKVHWVTQLLRPIIKAFPSYMPETPFLNPPSSNHFFKRGNKDLWHCHCFLNLLLAPSLSTIIRSSLVISLKHKQTSHNLAHGFRTGSERSEPRTVVLDLRESRCLIYFYCIGVSPVCISLGGCQIP